MKINIERDDDLINKALKYSKSKTKEEIINEGLTEYVRYPMRLKMLSLQGKVKWVGDLNKMRTYDKWEDTSKNSLKKKKIMRTNIDIDDKLLDEAIKLTGSKSKKEMVNYALEEVIKLEKIKQLRALRGKVKWEGNLDEMRIYDKWDNH